MRHFPNPPVSPLDQTLERDCEKGFDECVSAVYREAFKNPFGIEVTREFEQSTGVWYRLQDKPTSKSPIQLFTFRVRTHILKL